MPRSKSSRIYGIGKLNLRVATVLVCALTLVCCPADMTSAVGARSDNDLVLPISSSTVHRYANAVPANIALMFTRDGNKLTAVIQVQPLEEGEFVVVANRVSIDRYDRWSFVSGGFDTDVLCYDALNTIGTGQVEPSDWFRSGEEFLFCICSRERPLTVSYSRILDSNDHDNMQKWDSCRYATLDAIVGIRREKLCGYLPEVCQLAPWIYDTVVVEDDEYGRTRYRDETPPAKRVALTEAQFDRIIVDYDILFPVVGAVVSTINLPFTR